MQLDLLLDNANIVTVDKRRSRAGSLGILGGRIVLVGDVGEFADLAATRRVDVGGRTVVPGFNDAHNHMHFFGATLNEVSLRAGDVASVVDVVAAIGARVLQTPAGVWVRGSGYDDNKLAEKRHPTRQELDRVSPDNPVLLTHTSGHFCVVNTRAMELALIGDVPVPEGGVVAVGVDGQPNGLLEEQAQQLVTSLLHPRPQAEIVANLATANDVYLSEGITSCQEAGVGGILGQTEPLEVAAYQEARRTGRLKVRVTLMPAVEMLHPLDHHEDDDEPFALDLGLHSGFGDEWLKFGAVKIFSDGSLVGRTAAMCCDFENEPGNAGYLQMAEPKLHSLILKAHRSGWQVATHAIGDRAVDSVLTAYEAAIERYPRSDARHRIEHCGVCPPSSLERIAALGIIPVPQGRFVNELGDGMRQAIGMRVTDCYRQKSFLDAGIVVPGSSDRPVVSGSPLLGVHDMVNQLTASGAPFNPQEALTVEEALEAYTLGSAYAAFDEDLKGSLVVGKLADLVVLDRDITAIEPSTIKDTTVLATMVGGVFEYDLIGFG